MFHMHIINVCGTQSSIFFFICVLNAFYKHLFILFVKNIPQ